MVEKPRTENHESASDSGAMRSAARAPMEVQEVDLWWGSYAGRTMAPDFIVCGLLTAATLGAAWYLRTWHGGTIVRTVATALTAIVWLVQLAGVIYRVIAVNYRLTTHRLFYDYGFFRPIRHEIALDKVTGVLVERGPAERLMGVGRIRVLFEGGVVVFEGVRNAEHIAMEIRKQAERARGCVVSQPSAFRDS